MIIISIIGWSGSGKTHFIQKAIKKLKTELNFEVVVIKNIHQHQIDEEGKDSYIFTDAGAVLSIIKNKLNENAIFFKKKINIEELIRWVIKGPFKVDIIFTEGFRDLSYPTILCVKELSEIKPQLNENVKAISGLITTSKLSQKSEIKLPIVDAEENFESFLKFLKSNNSI
jgi:molybdopterin-guanine dinucleotide biosynthesis protein MobB